MLDMARSKCIPSSVRSYPNSVVTRCICAAQHRCASGRAGDTHVSRGDARCSAAVLQHQMRWVRWQLHKDLCRFGTTPSPHSQYTASVVNYIALSLFFPLQRYTSKACTCVAQSATCVSSPATTPPRCFVPGRSLITAHASICHSISVIGPSVSTGCSRVRSDVFCSQMLSISRPGHSCCALGVVGVHKSSMYASNRVWPCLALTGVVQRSHAPCSTDGPRSAQVVQLTWRSAV